LISASADLQAIVMSSVAIPVAISAAIFPIITFVIVRSSVTPTILLTGLAITAIATFHDQIDGCRSRMVGPRLANVR